MSDTTPGWQPDPTGKHDHRYWDGSQWTENVSDGGVAGVDPFEAATPDAPAVDEPTSIEEVPGEWEAPAPLDQTVVDQPPPASDVTAAWPTAPVPGAPAPPPPYVATDPVSPGDGGSKKGLLVGGAILAAVAVAVIAFLALGGGDDDDKDFDNASKTTQPTDGTSDGSDSTDGEVQDGSYGSDAELDELYDGCEAGDYADCDQLYLDSPAGSNYEAFGDTCGERNEPSGYCVDLYEGGDGGATDGATDGNELPANFEEQLADTYESTLNLDRDQAECLAGKLADVIAEGTLDEAEAMSEFVDYLSDCDISMEEIGGN